VRPGCTAGTPGTVRLYRPIPSISQLAAPAHQPVSTPQLAAIETSRQVIEDVIITDEIIERR
jgi:hypothetical protein